MVGQVCDGTAEAAACAPGKAAPCLPPPPSSSSAAGDSAAAAGTAGATAAAGGTTAGGVVAAAAAGGSAASASSLPPPLCLPLPRPCRRRRGRTSEGSSLAYTAPHGAACITHAQRGGWCACLARAEGKRSPCPWHPPRAPRPPPQETAAAAARLLAAVGTRPPPVPPPPLASRLGRPCLPASCRAACRACRRRFPAQVRLSWPRPRQRRRAMVEAAMQSRGAGAAARRRPRLPRRVRGLRPSAAAPRQRLPRTWGGLKRVARHPR